MKKFLFSFCCLSLLLIPAACTYDQVEVVASCDNDLVITIDEQTPSACGIASGALTVGISGQDAAAPVLYRLNGGTAQESPAFTDLGAGSYSITAQQGVCTATLEVTLENAEGLNAAAEATPSDCGSASGSINLVTADASGEVTFSLNGGTAQSGPTFSGLAPGVYEVVAEDAIGCRIVLEATVLSTVAFAEVEAIVANSCALSGCHAGNVSPDFRVRDNILNRANRILARTGNASMPPPSSGGSLSQAEIDAIACWVADGASE